MDNNCGKNPHFENLGSSFPMKEECIYTPQYCEENIWMLAKKIQQTAPEKLKCFYSVFISNENKTIPIWKQTAGSRKDGLVVWDYHVILVYHNGTISLVFDFDTQLKFPVPFSEYIKESLRCDQFSNFPYCKFFRVVPAESYLKYFSSDRRHMIKDGLWIKPPPYYPAICNSEERHNLEQYISMKSDTSDFSKFGQVFTSNGFIERFSAKNSNLD